jgi:hypothetical protein
MLNQMLEAIGWLSRRNRNFRAVRSAAATALPTRIEMLESRVLLTITAAQVPFSVIEGAAPIGSWPQCREM